MLVVDHGQYLCSHSSVVAQDTLDNEIVQTALLLLTCTVFVPAQV